MSFSIIGCGATRLGLQKSAIDPCRGAGCSITSQLLLDLYLCVSSQVRGNEVTGDKECMVCSQAHEIWWKKEERELSIKLVLKYVELAIILYSSSVWIPFGGSKDLLVKWCNEMA